MGSEMSPQEINEAVGRKLGYEIKSSAWWVDEYGNNSLNKDYCHDIKAAWEIVNSHLFIKTERREKLFFQIQRNDNDWTAGWARYPEEFVWDATHKSAPMSICLAFLKLP